MPRLTRRKLSISRNGLVLYLPLWKLDGASFQSKDAYGRLCTVTGALWRPNGREFNGISDLINCGRIIQIEGASALWTIQCWIKMTDELTANRMIFSYDDSNTLGTSDIYMRWDITTHSIVYQIGGGQAEKYGDIVDLNDYEWHFIELSKTATNGITREDGAEKLNAAYTGGAFGASYIFAIGDNLNVNHWKGMVGDFFIYAGRTLTLAEHQQNYLATKQKYT